MPDNQHTGATKFINMCIAAYVGDGEPEVEFTEGGRQVRIWPNGKTRGALITMPTVDWDVLVATVEAARAKVIAA